jgi:hypothetical protein
MNGKIEILLPDDAFKRHFEKGIEEIKRELALRSEEALQGYLGREEAGKLLGISKDSVTKLDRQGVLTGYTIEGINKRLYKREDVLTLPKTDFQHLSE